MPDRFLYPRTRVLKNRAGIREGDALEKFERRATTRRSRDPIRDFTADMKGLRAVHQTLFQDTYEWAGKTRADSVTVDGDTWTPDDHNFTKGSVVFGLASLSEHSLPATLAQRWAALESLRAIGQLTKQKWAQITADQIGAINYAHPFREGNGRAMRRFIELSAERYEFQVRIQSIRPKEWMKSSEDAMDERKTAPLERVLTRVTKRIKTMRVQKSGTVRKPRTVDLGQIAGAAAKGAKAIHDPQRRTRASQLAERIQTVAKKMQQRNAKRKPQPGTKGRGRDVER